MERLLICCVAVMLSACGTMHSREDEVLPDNRTTDVYISDQEYNFFGSNTAIGRNYKCVQGKTCKKKTSVGHSDNNQFGPAVVKAVGKAAAAGLIGISFPDNVGDDNDTTVNQQGGGANASARQKQRQGQQAAGGDGGEGGVGEGGDGGDGGEGGNGGEGGDGGNVIYPPPKPVKPTKPIKPVKPCTWNNGCKPYKHNGHSGRKTHGVSYGGY